MMRMTTQWLTMPVVAAMLILGLAQNAAAATMLATGGDITTNYTLNGTNYRAHIFTTVGVTSLNVTASGNVDVLVVAGGGGGGNSIGGGGGAGGLYYTGSYAITTGSLAITVGGGGAGGAAAANSGGANGTNSTFGTLTAYGGGGGAGYSTNLPKAGGSGGGAYALETGASGTNGQGNNGGNGAPAQGTYFPSGGGGGAGATGGSPAASNSASGNGGIGLQYSISGASNYYAGGGGGGSRGGGPSGTGGTGGGGNGGVANGNNAGFPGTNGTGGGGGAGAYKNAYSVGGKGGSGIVIVRCLLAEPTITNLPATNVTAASAWLNGYLVDTGGAPVTASVYWGAVDGGDPTSGLWAATNTLSGGPWTNGASVTWQATGLAANATYYYRYYATNSFGPAWAASSEHFLAGDVTVTNTDSSATRTPYGAPDTGTLTIWRNPSATNEALTIYYALGGTAVQGVDYTPSPAGTNITLPAGVASTNITITPLWGYGEKTVWLTLLPGLYAIGSPASNIVTIVDYVYTPGVNVTTNAGDWNDNAIWSLGRRPMMGDEVTVKHAVALSNATDYLGSFVITNATLTFTNWTTQLRVSSNVSILKDGKLTCIGGFTNDGMSNRVAVICSNLTISSGGSIDVYACGYLKGLSGAIPAQGPGASGSYGGKAAGASGPVYGTPETADLPGSGGNGRTAGSSFAGGNGGGAAWVQSTGTVRVDGVITANGQTVTQSAGGSGGGIHIECRVLEGTGTVTAIGGNSTSAQNAYGGGGGRIAVLFDAVAQAARPKPTITFSARSGASGVGFAVSDIGTLYFPTMDLMDPAWMPHSGELFLGTWTEWRVSAFNITNSWLRLPESGSRFSVTNAFSVVGTSARLQMSNATVNCGDFVLNAGRVDLNFGGAVTGTIINCTNNFLLTNAATLYFYANETNAATPPYGGLLSVGKDMFVVSNSWIYPYSAPTNGGSLLFRMSSLVVAAGGGINADGKGYAGGAVRGQGFGPGRGVDTASGAGYGGTGGRSGGTTYGSSNAPVDCGSGAYLYTASATTGRGGGLIRIEADQTVTLDGQLTANGNSGNATYYDGGGSGGGIYVRAKRFAGTSGSLTADGGAGSTHATNPGGGGGGGRIAVWSVTRAYGGSASVTNGDGYAPAATVGTIVWGQVPVPGSIFKIR